MADTVHIDLTWNMKTIGAIEKSTVRGLIAMGYDIASQARRNAPYVTGALRNTIRVQEVSDNVVEVIAGGTFGGRKVDYAWIREQGPNRDSSTEHYMENAQGSIMTGNYLERYFGNIT